MGSLRQFRKGWPQTAKNWFSPIRTPADAAGVIRDVAIGFLVVSGLEVLGSFSLFGPVAVSAATFAVLALLFLWSRSRGDATALLFFSLLALTEAVTSGGRADVASIRNSFISLILVGMGIRAVKAAFKYRPGLFS